MVLIEQGYKTFFLFSKVVNMCSVIAASLRTNFASFQDQFASILHIFSSKYQASEQN
jgi:hypothetical protein